MGVDTLAEYTTSNHLSSGTTRHGTHQVQRGVVLLVAKADVRVASDLDKYFSDMLHRQMSR